MEFKCSFSIWNDREMIFAPSGNISLFLNKQQLPFLNKNSIFFCFEFFQMKWDVGEHFHLLFSLRDRSVRSGFMFGDCHGLEIPCLAPLVLAKCSIGG